jgi:peptide/nickel transport system permease protein
VTSNPAHEKAASGPAIQNDRQIKAIAPPEAKSISLWRLMWRRFLRNRLAVANSVVLILLYVVCFTGDFIAPYNFNAVDEDFVFVFPQLPRFVDQAGQFHLRPFVYGLETRLDPDTFRWVHEPNFDRVFPVYFFVHGDPYKLFGFIPMDVHLFGVEGPGKIFLLGTDSLGRDMVARIFAGGRISLTIGLVGVSLTIIFGSSLGTASGYYGGTVDLMMQRVIEFLMSFPAIPLWAALAAAMPPNWSSIQRFFAISIILSLVQWTGLARQVRAKVLAYRGMDYTTAARAVGASDGRIIFRHMLPNALSHIIVVATLAIPGMILAETALSFLGLGIQPPLTSWGVLLQEAQFISVILQHPWLMIPGIFVIIAVLSFNFVGDGLRDAADPFAL